MISIGNKEAILKSNSDRKQSNLANNTHRSMDNYSKSSDSCSIIITTYRPVQCPVKKCRGILSPSTMILHFEYMHRDISTTVLDLAEGNVTMNISLQYYRLQPLHPDVVTVVLLQGFGDDRIPILINMNLLPDVKPSSYKICSTKKHRSKWLLIWLSSLHIFPYVFSITFRTYGLPRISFSQQCTPILLHEEYDRNKPLKSPLEDARIMLINVKSLEKLINTENGLYIKLVVHGNCI